MSAKSSSPTPSTMGDRSDTKGVRLLKDSGSGCSAPLPASAALMSNIKTPVIPFGSKISPVPDRFSTANDKEGRSPSPSYSSDEDHTHPIQLPFLSKRRMDSPSTTSLPPSGAAHVLHEPPPPHISSLDVAQCSLQLSNSPVCANAPSDHPPPALLSPSPPVDSERAFLLGGGKTVSEGSHRPLYLYTPVPPPSPFKGVESFKHLQGRLSTSEPAPSSIKLIGDLGNQIPDQIGPSKLPEEENFQCDPSQEWDSTDSLSLAVVPLYSTFSPRQRMLTSLRDSYAPPHPTPTSRSSSGGSHRQSTSALSSRSYSAPHIAPYANHMVQVCPTCHRPFDANFAPPLPPVEEKRFTPHYFRQLSIVGPTPLLAIMDVPHDEDEERTEKSPSGRPLLEEGKNTARPSSFRSATAPANATTLYSSSKAQSESPAFPSSNRSPKAPPKLLIPAGPSLSNDVLSSFSFSTPITRTTARGLHGTSHLRRRTRSFGRVSESECRRGVHRSPPHTASIDMHQSIYTYVSPTVLQDGGGSPASPNPEGSSRQKNSTGMFMDRELWELLVSHQAKLRGTTTSSLIGEEENKVARGESPKQVEEEGDFISQPPPSSHPSPSTYYEKYFLEAKKLGSGTFGGVYLCMHVMEGVPLGTFALKKIPVGNDISYLQNVLKEVRILEEVKRHPNVIEYNHSWVDEAKVADFGPSVRCLFILMEYANEGSLESYLERHSTVLSTMAVWYFFLSAVAGTAHLHQKNILHRDLKPQNLLLSAFHPNALPRVLVSDFGTAALLGENTTARTGGTGTLEYMAPELFERDLNAPPDQEKYIYSHTKSSDVWSLGLILHYLACATALPKRGRNGSVIVDVSSLSPVSRPPEMIELIRAMVQMDPKKRPTCKDIMRSTVVQTLLYSFNNVPFSAMDLFLPLYESPTSYQIPCTSENNFRQEEELVEEDENMDEDRSHTDTLNSPLESSRVELLSTMISPTPLIQQYQNQEMRSAMQSGVPSSLYGNTESPAYMGVDSPRIASSSYFPADGELEGKKHTPPYNLRKRIYAGSGVRHGASRKGIIAPNKGGNDILVLAKPRQLLRSASVPKSKEASVQTEPVTIIDNES